MFATNNLFCVCLTTCLFFAATLQTGLYCGNREGRTRCYIFNGKDFENASESAEIDIDNSASNHLFIINDLANTKTLLLQQVNLNNELISKIGFKGVTKDLSRCGFCENNVDYCLQQNPEGSRSVNGIKFGIIFCNVNNYASKGDLASRCPKSKMSMAVLAAPGVDRGSLFVPIIDGCDTDKGRLDNTKYLVKLGSSGDPVATIICPGGAWDHLFNGYQITHSDLYMRTPTGSVSVKKPTYYNGLKCINTSSGNKGVIKLNGGNSKTEYGLGETAAKSGWQDSDFVSTLGQNFGNRVIRV